MQEEEHQIHQALQDFSDTVETVPLANEVTLHSTVMCVASSTFVSARSPGPELCEVVVESEERWLESGYCTHCRFYGCKKRTAAVNRKVAGDKRRGSLIRRRGGGFFCQDHIPLRTEDLSTSTPVPAKQATRAPDPSSAEKQASVMPDTPHWGLVSSSALFFIPAAVALRRSPWLWGLSVCYSLTALVSIAFWLRPVPGFRRDADLVVAKTSFLITGATGISRVTDVLWLRMGWPLLLAIPFLYWLSLLLYGRKSSLWILAHMGMHCCISAGMTVVLLGSTTAAELTT